MKKSMNRIICGLTAAVMMGTLTACSRGQEETEVAIPSGSKVARNIGSAAQQRETQAEMEAIVIWRVFDDQFQNGFRIIMQDEAEKLGGTALNVQDAVNDISTANSKLEVALSKKMDVVATYTPDRESIENMMKKRDADGVPAAFFNMEPTEDTMKRHGNIRYVGAQARQSGEIYAQTLINYWNDKKDIADRNGGSKLQLVILQGGIGQQDVTLRTDAYKETLEKNGIDYEIPACDTVNWGQTQVLGKMNAWTTAYGIDGIEGVLCNDDSTAIGAAQVCISNGYNSGDVERFVPIMGTDTSTNILGAMKADSLLGIMLNDRKSQSGAIIDMIKVVHAGMEITKDVAGVDCTVNGRYVWMPYVIVDENNLGATLEDMLAVAQSE